MSRKESLIVKLPIALKPRTRPVQKAPTAANIHSDASNPKAPELSSYVSRNQVALALAITRSKPDGMSAAEYCEELSRHIRSGRPPSKDDIRYVDTVEFWKKQYTTLHDEKKRLEERVQVLEASQSIRRSNQAGETVQDDDSYTLQLLAELSAQCGDPKRKRPATSEAIEGSEDDRLAWDVLGENQIVKLSNYVLRLGRQRGQLDTLVSETHNLDHIKTLAKQASQMVMAMDGILSDCCLPLRTLKTTTEDAQSLVLFQQVMNQTGVAFISCFNAMNELCRTIPGRSKKAELIYRMVMFFNKSLDVLHTMSKMQVENERDRLRSLGHKRARTDEGEYAVSKYMGSMLASIARNLDWRSEQPGHSELLEGILFSILEHTGRLVSEAVFEEHVALSDNPGCITSGPVPVDKERLKFEFKYVAQVLHAALGGAEKKKLVAKVLVGDDEALNSPRSGELARRAQDLLQRTLVKSAIGGHDVETLRLPTPPAEGYTSSVKISENQNQEIYGSEWFIGTVWSLVGWDLVP